MSRFTRPPPISAEEKSAVKDFVRAFTGFSEDKEEDKPSFSLCVEHCEEQFFGRTAVFALKAKPRDCERKLGDLTKKLNLDLQPRKAQQVKNAAKAIIQLGANKEDAWKPLHVLLNLADRPCETIPPGFANFSGILPTCDYVVEEDDEDSKDEEVFEFSEEDVSSKSSSGKEYNFHGRDPFKKVKIAEDPLSDWTDSDTESDPNPPVPQEEPPDPAPKWTSWSEKRQAENRQRWEERHERAKAGMCRAMLERDEICEVRRVERPLEPGVGTLVSVINPASAVRDLLWSFRMPELAADNLSWTLVVGEDGIVQPRKLITVDGISPETFESSVKDLASDVQLVSDLRKRTRLYRSSNPMEKVPKCVVAFYSDVAEVLGDFDAALASFERDAGCFTSFDGLKTAMEPWLRIVKVVSELESTAVGRDGNGKLRVDFKVLWNSAQNKCLKEEIYLSQRFFMASLLPFLKGLELWVAIGQSDEPDLEDFAVQKGRGFGDVKSKDFWEQGYLVDPEWEDVLPAAVFDCLDMLNAGRSHVFLEGLKAQKNSGAFRERDCTGAYRFAKVWNELREKWGLLPRKPEVTWTKPEKNCQGLLHPSRFGKLLRKLTTRPVLETDAPRLLLPYQTRGAFTWHEFQNQLVSKISNPLSEISAGYSREVLDTLTKGFSVLDHLVALPEVLLFQNGLLMENLLFKMFKATVRWNNSVELDLVNEFHAAMTESETHAPLAPFYSLRWDFDRNLLENARVTSDRIPILDAFEIRFHPKWPMTSFVSEEDLGVYRRTAKFMIATRFVKGRLSRLKFRCLRRFPRSGPLKIGLFVRIRLLCLSLVTRLEFFLWNGVVNVGFRRFTEDLLGSSASHLDFERAHRRFLQRLRRLDLLDESSKNCQRLKDLLSQIFAIAQALGDAWSNKKKFIEFTIPKLEETLVTVQRLLIRSLLLVEDFRTSHDLDLDTQEFFSASFGDKSEWTVWSV